MYLYLLQTSDSPFNSDREKKSSKCRRPRSVSMTTEPFNKRPLNPASWHQFQRLPPPKYNTLLHKIIKYF